MVQMQFSTPGFHIGVVVSLLSLALWLAGRRILAAAGFLPGLKPAAGRISRPALLALCFLASPLVFFFAARAVIALAAGLLESRYPPPGQMAIVDGHKLYIYCTGSGSPTVVLEPGMGSDWAAWRPVISKLTALSEVCVYDRAGYGWSEAGPMPRTALRIATELHELLMKAQVPRPYLLLGHSFGGYVARMYADRFPDSLRGIVMVDPSQEEDGHAPDPGPPFTFSMRGLVSLLPPIGSERLGRLYKGESALPVELKNAPAAYRRRFLIASPLRQLKSERNEFESLPLTEAELRSATFPEDLPLTVITAGRLENGEAHRARQAKLAQMSRRGKQIVAESSGHSVHLFQPDLIAEAVEEMIGQGR